MRYYFRKISWNWISRGFFPAEKARRNNSISRKKIVSSTHIFPILEHYATKAALLQIKAKKTCLSTFCEYTGNFLQLQWVSWCSFISDIRRYLVTSLHKKNHSSSVMHYYYQWWPVSLFSYWLWLWSFFFWQLHLL